MPDDAGKPTHRDDPYVWALAQAEAIRALPAGTAAFDRDSLMEFLEESANSMVAAVKSPLIRLMADLTTAACSRDAAAIGHWRSKCRVFHQDITIRYHPSMDKDIDVDRLWRFAVKCVFASFADHGEPAPTLPTHCPFTLAQLVDEDLDMAEAVESLRERWSGG